MRSDKSTVLALAALAAALVLVACGDETEKSSMRTGSAYDDGADLLDFGQDWISELEREQALGGRASAAANVRPKADGATEKQQGPRSYWSVLLRTFPGGGSDTAARTMIASLPRIDPALGQAHVHSTSKGAKVLFGTYVGPDDDAAKRDLDWVKELKLGGRVVFPMAMLVRVSNTQPTDGEAEPFALSSARKRFPNVSPLYTLQIGVWGQFGNTRLKIEDIERDAEAHVRKLRAEGHEAYYKHDPGLAMSMVTVGLFDRTAYDIQAGIYSAEVEALFRKFPKHLMNGEPVLIQIDKRRPELGMQPQQPRLVLVPEL